MNRSNEGNESCGEVVSTNAGPNPWMNAKQAAAYAGCHEETIRRGYLSGHLKATPFGTRGRRIHLSDLEGWMRNGARTR
jgi:excisionase family DNA binding protein